MPDDYIDTGAGTFTAMDLAMKEPKQRGAILLLAWWRSEKTIREWVRQYPFLVEGLVQFSLAFPLRKNTSARKTCQDLGLEMREVVDEGGLEGWVLTGRWVCKENCK